jgi:hypothetical protein
LQSCQLDVPPEPPSSSTVHADSITQDRDTRKGKAARNTRKIDTLQLQPPTQNPVTATAWKPNADRPPTSDAPDPFRRLQYAARHQHPQNPSRSQARKPVTSSTLKSNATADAPQVATRKNTHSTTADFDIVQPQDLSTTTALQAQEAVNTTTNAAADIDIANLQVRCLEHSLTQSPDNLKSHAAAVSRPYVRPPCRHVCMRRQRESAADAIHSDAASSLCSSSSAQTKGFRRFRLASSIFA